jgi:hypothetical protein
VTAGLYNIVIEQGGTFRRTIFLKTNGVAMSLANYTARMQIRPSVTSSVLLHELTEANNGITIDDALGRIDLFISDDDTAAMIFRRGVYDLEIESESTGDVLRVLQGGVQVSPNVTR